MPPKPAAQKKKQQTNGTKKKAASPTAVLIDFPKEGETVFPGHYAIRIAAQPNAHVECCINEGDWTACRTADGFYWFDWFPNQAGESKITVRFKDEKGRWKTSTKRTCVISTN